MPVTYKIDKARGIIRTKCSGKVTFEEVLNHLRFLQRDPECPVCLDVLLDSTECRSEPAAEQLRTVSGAIRSIQFRVQFDACAIVAETDVLFGIARMFEVFAEERFRVTEVFRSVTDAEAWLSSQQSPNAAGESK
jgi:hypothetical protein